MLRDTSDILAVCVVALRFKKLEFVTMDVGTAGNQDGVLKSVLHLISRLYELKVFSIPIFSTVIASIWGQITRHI